VRTCSDGWWCSRSPYSNRETILAIHTQQTCSMMVDEQNSHFNDHIFLLKNALFHERKTSGMHLMCCKVKTTKSTPSIEATLFLLKQQQQ
jgi:hypothetical protein